MKTAFITGITGQDGSYLAEYLLSQGYEVYGMIRRSSSFNTKRLEHLHDPSEGTSRGLSKYYCKNLYLAYGDLTDASILSRLLHEIRPDEIYNLGAQSHVRVSFEQPEFTSNVNALGTLRLLEAARDLKDVRFYQASSSEMFGNAPAPQNESSPMLPCSPYGISKVAAYSYVGNYRKCYNMFTCNGILFNHETLVSSMPLIYKMNDGLVNIDPIADVCQKSGFFVDKTLNQYQTSSIQCNLHVWDRNGWTKVKYASAYPVDQHTKIPISINARNAIYTATSDHVVIMSDDSEKKIQDISIMDKVCLCDYPEIRNVDEILNISESKLLGMLVGDGCFSHSLKFTFSDPLMKEEVKRLWSQVGDGKWSYNTVSGFTKQNVGQVILRGSGLKWFSKFNIYTEERGVFGHRYKRIPVQILNASPEIQRSFLEGYDLADGLKANKCKYLFKNFKTNSATLAAGLLFLVSKVTGQEYNITLEQSDQWGKTQTYYSINLLSDSSYGQNSPNKCKLVLKMLDKELSQREIHHQCKPSNEVKKIVLEEGFKGWFYDLETDSGTFHCGVGQGVVHNSPRRGETFVTRKITRAAARIKLGLQNNIVLGNLDAKRDWGYAPENCQMMHLMLQQDVPDDYVVATGETHSVREFLEAVFNYLDLDPYAYLRTDERLLRPQEVNILLGDSSKALSQLGWRPQVKFVDLVKLMTDSDMRIAKQEKILADSGEKTVLI